MRDVLEKARPEIVVHIAARASVRPSIERPREYADMNIGGTVNLLELAREFRPAKFLFGSSSSVYGATRRAPFSEDQVKLRPISPYAASKLTGEMLDYTYSRLHYIPVNCLRSFTVYGSRQRLDLAIHKFTALMVSGKPVPIFGDGSTGRDYTHISDIVAGILAAMEFEPRPSQGAAPFEVINLGNSHPVELNELVDLLERVTGRRAIPEFKSAQPGDVQLTWADVSKAERLLGYRPSTSLEKAWKNLSRGIGPPVRTGAPDSSFAQRSWKPAPLFFIRADLASIHPIE
jgi:UDP-glucuronate 4-epimerase